jgi:ferredoxin
MKVWVDTNECMGAGTCEMIAPAVFYDAGDGTWSVKEDARHFGTELLAPGGAAVRIPESLIDDVIDAAEQCPGACIHIEG